MSNTDQVIRQEAESLCKLLNDADHADLTMDSNRSIELASEIIKVRERLEKLLTEKA